MTQSKLDTVVAAYDASDKGQQYPTEGKGQTYRQIRIPDWSSNAHYEFLVDKDTVMVEIHLEKSTQKTHRTVKQARPVLEEFALANHGSLGQSVTFREVGHGRLRVLPEPKSTAAEIAELMSELIEATLRPLTEALGTTWPSDVKEMLSFLEDERKRQIILYGPPGTGKTRLARRAAYALLDGPPPLPDDDAAIEAFFSERDAQFKLVVFHPAYEYDQFIGGLSVELTDKGQPHYEKLPGVFTQMCEAAAICDEPHILVIDEINRGNLPKLLGELIYALEYRGNEVVFSFDGEKRPVPKNLYVIGTMNTADRSVGTLDAAVRRRFNFHRVGPEPEVVGDSKLKGLMRTINRELLDLSANIPELADLQVGHSYFLGCDAVAFDLRWRLEVRPLLDEYRRLTGDPRLEALCKDDWRDLLPNTPPPEQAAPATAEGSPTPDSQE